MKFQTSDSIKQATKMITSITEQAMQVEVERIILLQEAQEELSYLLTTTPHEFEQKLHVHTVQGLKLRMQFIRDYKPSSETHARGS